MPEARSCLGELKLDPGMHVKAITLFVYIKKSDILCLSSTVLGVSKVLAINVFSWINIDWYWVVIR